MLESAAVLLLAGCGLLVIGSPTPTAPGDGPICTQIGCESQVLYELDADIASGATYLVRACIGDRCEEASVEIPPADGGAVPAGTQGPFTLDPQNDVVAFRIGEGDFSGSHAVSLTLDDGSSEPVSIAADVVFERTQPNGPRCEPICWQAVVRAQG